MLASGQCFFKAGTLTDTSYSQSGNCPVKPQGLCWGLGGSREVGGVCKTMLRFIAEELTDASGAAPPHPQLHPSLPSDEPVMDYSSSPSNLDGF